MEVFVVHFPLLEETQSNTHTHTGIETHKRHWIKIVFMFMTLKECLHWSPNCKRLLTWGFQELLQKISLHPDPESFFLVLSHLIFFMISSKATSLAFHLLGTMAKIKEIDDEVSTDSQLAYLCNLHFGGKVCQ